MGSQRRVPERGSERVMTGAFYISFCFSLGNFHPSQSSHISLHKSSAWAEKGVTSLLFNNFVHLNKASVTKTFKDVELSGLHVNHHSSFVSSYNTVMVTWTFEM